MMIKMEVGLSGSAYTLNPGDELDFPQDEALRLIAKGYALPVVKAPVERAVRKPAAETRVFDGKPRRGRKQ